MSEQFQVTVKAARNQFGKLSGSYRAEVGTVSAVGTTKDEARFILGEKLNDAERYACTRRYLVTPKGTVFALYHIPFGGWAYDIIHPMPAGGALSPGSCLLSDKSFTDAYATMKRHWEAMCEDERLCPHLPASYPYAKAAKAGGQV